MANLSKILTNAKGLLTFIGETRERKINSLAVLGLILFIVKLKRGLKKSKFGYLAKGMTKKKG